MNPPGAPQGGDDTRNLILAMALCVAILFGWEYFVGGPQRERAQAAAEAQQQLQPQAAPGAPATLEDGAADPAEPRERAEVLAQGARRAIESLSFTGSINLEGARFDDLALKRYHETIAREENVKLLSPQGAEHHLDAVFGWQAGDAGTIGVGARALWTAAEGATLSPETPLILTHESGDGIVVTRTVTVDENYLFTIADVVENRGDAARALRPYAVVRRTGLPADFTPNQIVHQGMSGAFGPELALHQTGYRRAENHARDKAKGERLEDSRIYEGQGKGGWLGLSDHYWLTAAAPAQTETIEAWFDSRPSPAGVDFRAAYRGEVRTIAPGAKVEYTQHFFAGAKRVRVLQAYQEALGLPKFDRAVDWGFLWILTRPFFWLLDTFGALIGNFGLAIMATTVVVRLLLFPLANQSFDAMSKLKKLQPKMKEIQEKYAADKQRQQQEMLKLYQTEKVNPVAGCVPILLQIPIFYALYKVLTVTIEMRHAPFFGWIQDLSAPDPTTIFNLFGLLPFDPTVWPVVGAFLQVGVWPILYGVTMWAVTALNPPAPDPIQRQVFAMLPIVFVFLFGGFAAGLVIYWTWSNCLSILQQYVIMRRNGVETEFDKFIAKRLGRDASGAA